MAPLVRSLATYAEYHRDRRNVATHLLGIPMIFLAVVILLSRPVAELGGVFLSPAMLLAVAAVVFYLRLDSRFGATMTLLLALCLWAGHLLAIRTTVVWLGWGGGLFVVGWVIQFVGHAFEGRKPAFFDDLKSLLVGPLFVVAELSFALGLRREVQAAISAAIPSSR